MQETRLAKIQKFFRSPGGHFALYLIIPVVIFTIIAIAVISGRSAQKQTLLKSITFLNCCLMFQKTRGIALKINYMKR